MLKNIFILIVIISFLILLLYLGLKALWRLAVNGVKAIIAPKSTP